MQLINNSVKIILQQQNTTCSGQRKQKYTAKNNKELPLLIPIPPLLPLIAPLLVFSDQLK